MIELVCLIGFVWLLNCYHLHTHENDCQDTQALGIWRKHFSKFNDYNNNCISNHLSYFPVPKFFFVSQYDESISGMYWCDKLNLRSWQLDCRLINFNLEVIQILQKCLINCLWYTNNPSNDSWDCYDQEYEKMMMFKAYVV